MKKEVAKYITWPPEVFDEAVRYEISLIDSLSNRSVCLNSVLVFGFEASMELPDLISEEQVAICLQSRERDDSVREMLIQLAETEKLKKDQVEPVLRAIIKRESLGTTAVGRQIAVPHARVEGFDKTLVGVGLSEEGVDFHSLDGLPVHAIFLVVGPQEDADRYIEVLKEISNLTQKGDFRRFLAQADTAKEVVDLVEEMSL